MTRKDYRAIAAILNTWSKDRMYTREVRDDPYFIDPYFTVGSGAYAGLVREFSLALKNDNPNFDSEAFHKACYL